jgi:hypothetical protein
MSATTPGIAFAAAYGIRCATTPAIDYATTYGVRCAVVRRWRDEGGPASPEMLDELRMSAQALDAAASAIPFGERAAIIQTATAVMKAYNAARS